MKNLNKICMKFFELERGDETIRLHSRCVIESCLDIAKHTDLDKDIFIIAGWIHDLGRKQGIKNHHEISAVILNKFLEIHPELKEKEERVKDCILNHRKEGDPKTVYGIVFKAADKIAFYNEKWKRANLSIL